MQKLYSQRDTVRVAHPSGSMLIARETYDANPDAYTLREEVPAGSAAVAEEATEEESDDDREADTFDPMETVDIVDRSDARVRRTIYRRDLLESDTLWANRGQRREG